MEKTQNLWKKHVEKVRIKHLLYLNDIDELLKNILLFGKLIKVDNYQVNDKFPGMGMDFYQGTDKGHMFEINLEYNKRVYTITLGKAFEPSIKCEDENLDDTLFDMIYETREYTELYWEFIDVYLKEIGLELPKFDFNKAMNNIKIKKA